MSELKAETAELQAKAAETQARLIQADNDRKTKELEEARELQLSMLPKELPVISHLDIAVYMKTATEVGGDYYDFIIKDAGKNGQIAIAVGDVSGHGISSALLMATVRSSLRQRLSQPGGAGEIISDVNRHLAHDERCRC